MRAIRYLLISSLIAITACGDNLKGLADVDAGPTGPACRDGVDNDGDGDVDFPDDLGCNDPNDETEDSAPKPKCSDNRDNDADGKIDFPFDPGCTVASDDDETDDCPSGPNCPACGNHQDDDFNGVTDYPDDQGCDAASDTVEFVDDPDACGVGLKILPLPASGVAQGMLDTSSASNLMTTCGGGTGKPGVAYVLLLTRPKVLVASTDDPFTAIDSTLSVRSGSCTEMTALQGCNEDISAANHKSLVTVSLSPGTYYIIVEGYDLSIPPLGKYQLTVQLFAGEGETCTMQSDCGPGLLCRIPAGQTQMVCSKPVCSDGLDDDGDGKIDFPNDPGCDNVDDATETDTCPSGPGCPACGDGIDNDGDMNIDYPADTSCMSASASSESCNGEQDPIVNIVTSVNNGTLVGAHDDHDPTCVTSNGPDVLYTLNVPKMETLRLSTEGSVIADTVLSVMTSTCTEPGIACDDDSGGTPANSSLITLSNVAPGSYIVAVDAFGAATNTFVLTVTGTIAATGSCETPLFTSGAFTCAGGLVCQGPAGAKTCSSECSDGVDNNGDGKIDYPNDPGCVALNDNTETTVCPGTACPVCSDSIDNDADGNTDYPLDTSCGAASGTSESCNSEQDPISDIVSGLTFGTLVGAHDDHDPSCVTTNGVDVTLTLNVPQMATLRLSTEGSATLDTVLSLMGTTCTEPSLLCDDNSGVTPANSSLINATNIAAGSYTVAVDAFNAATVLSTFQLAVSGTIALGGSCESPLVAAGAFTCAGGFACDGPIGARTCRSQCSDGIDNNGDGKTDFPNDPGCTALNDNTETTVCPGATCPVCSDGLDNDGDGQTDYPADASCTAASGGSEQCNGEQDPIQNIVTSVNNGTLVGAHDDHNPSCTTPDAPDVLFTLTVPAMASLRLSTENSAILDTVLSLLPASCAEPSLACDDDSGNTPANSSIINTTNLAAGNYVVAVDQYSTFVTPNTFVLTVTGTIAPGGSCATPLFTSGAFTCTAGQTCTAGTCQ